MRIPEDRRWAGAPDHARAGPIVRVVLAVFQNNNGPYHQLIRYAVFGMLSTLVDLTCLYGLTEYAGLHYAFSVAAAFTLGVLSNHGINVLWVFPARQHRIVKELYFVFGISLIGLGLSELIIIGLVEKAQINYMHAKIVSLGLVFFWNFGCRRKWVFSNVTA